MARRYRRKRFYTTPERILLHLAPQGHETTPLPRAFTQDGIAAAILSGRSTVTKWLGQLERRGLVTQTRTRMDPYPHPKTVYGLSDDGRKEADALFGRLSAEMIEVKAPALGTLSVRLTDAPGLVASGLDLARSASLVRGGRLDLANLPPAPPKAERFLVWREGLRQVERLFGRWQELRGLDAWSTSNAKVLVVTGLPGIGKSALVAEWIRRRKPPAHVFGYPLHSSTKASALLAEFGAFLASLGHRSLVNELAQGRTLDRALVRRLLAKELARLRTLVILDGLEQAQREIAGLVTETFLTLAGTTPLRLILVTRRVPAWAVSDPLIGILNVHGLRAEDAIALLRHRGVRADTSELREFATLTGGHPLLLHLVAQGGATSVTAVQEYFEALWRSLTPEERRLLETAGIARRPVPERVLETAAGAKRGTILQLRAKNLLEQTVAGRYLVHDLLREFLHAHEREAHAKKLHERLARPLLREAESRNRWDGVYHLLQAGRTEEVALFLESEGAPLMNSVAAEEIATLARSHPSDSTDVAASCVFSELLGDSLRILGHVEPALFQYTHAARVAEAAGKAERIPRLLRKMASLERWRNRYPKALGYLVEAQARLSTSPNPRELAEVFREMALIEETTGELPKAASHLNSAIDVATEASDWGSLSRALQALGSLESWRGFQQRGLDYCLEGLRIAERTGNLTEVAHAEIVVGTALAEMGRFGESLHHYDKGRELSRRLGNFRLSAYATLNRTGALLDLHRYEEARGALKESAGYFEILEERDTLALLLVYEGQCEMGLDRWGRAQRLWDEGLAQLRRFGSPMDLARSLKEIGTFHIQHDDPGRAQSFFLEARELAAKLKNETLRSEVDRELSRMNRIEAT